MSSPLADGPRIGFLIDRWEPERGGAEGALALFARHLELCGAEVLVFAKKIHGRNAGRSRIVSSGGFTRATREARLGNALVEAALEADCDLTIGARHLPQVDLYWPHGGSYRSSWAASREASGREPMVPATGRHRVFLELEDLLLGRGGARSVICVSDLVRAELERDYPPCVSRLHTIENGVDTARFHPRERDHAGSALRKELGLRGGVPLILFSAMQPVLKGLPQLFEALGRLRAKPWFLLAAGLKHPRRWRRMARKAGLGPDRVEVRGWQDPVALSSAADLCVHPTWRDSSSQVVLECLSSGTPVITTKRAGAASAVYSTVAGHVLENPGDVDALAAAMEHWIELIREGAVDRLRVRGGATPRDLPTWLERLEREVVELLPGGSANGQHA